MPTSASEPPIRVTAAAKSRFEDQRQRMGQYCLLMGIRMACIIAIFLTPRPWGWLWVLGAVVLPYVAVLIANAAGEARKVDLRVAPKRKRTALGDAASPMPASSPAEPRAESSSQRNTDRGSSVGPSTAETTSGPAMVVSATGNDPAVSKHSALAASTSVAVDRSSQAAGQSATADVTDVTTSAEPGPAVLRGEVIHD